jgi:radical SAM protein with 4Fe4S-binding SPASM domain
MIKLVKVNTFQKGYDTLYRNFKFSWNQGHYLKYLRNRVQWYLYPNLKKVAKFPLHLDIETTAKCNLRCQMCPRRYLSNERYNAYNHMDMVLYKKLVDECAENKLFSIRLSWRGEVLVNPRLPEYIHYAKVVRKIPNVSFLTNGSLLKGKLAEKIIDYGLDYISVSVDGLKEVYDKIRNPLKFENIYENLKNFQEMKKEKGVKKPVVRITTLWPAIATDPDKYCRKMEMVADKIVYNPLKDYSITTQDKDDFIMCQFLWERLFVGFDGKVQPCSNLKNEFVKGDANKNTIKEIWLSDQMNKLREKHIKGQRLDIFPCSECSYGVDFEKRWKGRDWANWDPDELLIK